jgi:hypothetical protein
MLEAEGSCAQPQASNPAGAQTQTAPQGGRGPPAGSSQAGDGSVERRRSSVVVVVLGQHHEKKGAATTAAAVVVEQVRLTLMALGLALIMAPVAAAIEPCAALFTKALPNFVPSLLCEGMLTERRGVHLVILVLLGHLIAMNGFQVAAVEANPRAMRLLWHTLLVGSATGVVFSLWYASAVSSPSALQALGYGVWTAVVVYFVPYVSFTVSGLVTAKRRSSKRAALEIAYGACVSLTSELLALAVSFYVTLSDQVTSGLAGLAINGKVAAHVKPDSPAANSCGPLFWSVCSGLLWPLLQWALRSAIQRLLRAKVSRSSLDYAGVLVLLLEIVTSTPQFYVLTMCVADSERYANRVGVPHTNLALASRIDETPLFIASAVSSFAVECIGAAVSARAAHIELDQNTGRELLSRVKSSRAIKSTRRIHPSEQDTGPSKEAPAASRESEAEAAARSPAGQSEAAAARQLRLAVKIAHAELGEKTALFLGCTVAARVGGLSSEWAIKALTLLLLEALSDLAKAGAYAAGKIDVGHVRFNLHWPSLLGVALVGGGSCALLLAAISINCLFGEDIANTFG